MKTKRTTPSKTPVMSLDQVLATIKSVGKGSAKLPDWAGNMVYIGKDAKEYWETVSPEGNSLDSFSKLYNDNKELLSVIARLHPASVAELAQLVQREQSNVSRTLGKLEKTGLIKLVPSDKGRAKRPELVMRQVRIDLDLVSGQVSLAGLRHAANV